MELAEVTCPTCFEPFSIPIDAPEGAEMEIDYDCEVCCRPMVIQISPESVVAFSLDDLAY